MDDIEEDEEPHCETLERYTAKQAQTLIFGDAAEPDVYSVSLVAAQRVSPAISVYVIADDPEQERAIQYMFEKVPTRMVRMRNTDFFGPNAGVFPSMPTDLAAALRAAQRTFGEQPVLVIDGNKAITFSAMDSKSQIIGGGLTAGMSIRLRSLADAVNGMPRIMFEELKHAIQNAKENGGFPTFAKDTKTAIMSSACSEVATQLRSIVKRFVAAVGGGNEVVEQFTVVITGGDGKLLFELLQNDASGIVTVDESQSLSSKVKLIHKKNMSHYGMGNVLDSKCNEKSQLYPENDLLYRAMGLRVAKAFPAPDENNDFFKRGSILYVNKKQSLEGHEFVVRFDDDGALEPWTAVQLYDGLVAYSEIGEKPTKTRDVEWVVQKKAKSAEVLKALIDQSVKVQERKEGLTQHADEDGKVAKYLSQKAEAEHENKIKLLAEQQELQRKQKERPSKKQKRNEKVDPSVYLRKRVAKTFPIADPDSPDDQMKDELFFGTITKVNNRKLMWFQVKYDDGDEEEFDMHQLNTGLTYYEEMKYLDPTLRPGGVQDRLMAADILAEHQRGEERKAASIAATRVAEANPMEIDEPGKQEGTNATTNDGKDTTGNTEPANKELSAAAKVSEVINKYVGGKDPKADLSMVKPPPEASPTVEMKDALAGDTS